MPLGAVTAFYGIKGCMSIIHGSQGCSTYIRRHMATHYNEPIDIASSSLTEQGTVYGGEQNLKAGIKNLKKQYDPEVIGVATTCLAETIGEDVPRILKSLEDDPECKGVEFISVQSPGYGGTQYEGFVAATLAAIKRFAGDITPNNAVNVVATYMSPAEMRYIKDVLDAFGIYYILVPDISDNLDNVFNPVYSKLPSSGTAISDIRRMAGARFTIEIGLFTGNYSPAMYLKKQFGIPYKNVPLPIGLRATDEFMKLLSELSGKPVPEKIKKDRGRYLDAMVDSHKYCGEARTAVYGEPDAVYAITRFCCECGAFPAVVACGTKCSRLGELLSDEISDFANKKLETGFDIVYEADFDRIEQLVKEKDLNLMIGNSDGRRILEKMPQVALIRDGFPIHDRVGGQRIMHFGYEGSLRLLDGIANAMLNRRETTFRRELYTEYYRGGKREAAALKQEQTAAKTKEHPCFDCSACGSARIHLPVATECNIQCNYCVRKYDCANESRPGVTNGVLTPEEAAEKYLLVRKNMPNLKVAGIAGPGDSLANFECTRKTFELIRAYDKDVIFCLSTNGLMLPFYAQSLVDLSVSHVTVTVNAADAKTGAKIYAFIDYFGKRLYGEEAAQVLLNNQLAGIRFLSENGVAVKVNIVMLKSINESQIGSIVNMVKNCGAKLTNIMQLIPVEGCPFENLDIPSNKELNDVRKDCSSILPQMYHCRQCRADAIGTLDNDVSIEYASSQHAVTKHEEEAESHGNTFRFAVVTKSGKLIDCHFGSVSEFYIYDYDCGNVSFVEKRSTQKYCAGPSCVDEKQSKIGTVIKTLNDCIGVICMRIGTEPERELKKNSIYVFRLYDRIEDGVKKAARQLLKAEKKVNIINN